MSNRAEAVTRCTRWGARILGAMLLWSIAVTAHARGAVGIEILPPHPLPGDNVVLRLGGVWSDGCVPTAPQVSMVEGIIVLYVHTSTLDVLCWQALTPWELLVPLGPLAVGPYHVLVTTMRPLEQSVIIGSGAFFVGESVGGSVTGVTPRRLMCRNWTTGQKLMVPLYWTTAWNCEDVGLIVNPGDRIQQTVIGIAE